MAAQRTPKVFLSHSHHDKRVARCIARRLTAHGLKVWIDERELKIGATLTASIRTHIQDADALLVVASQASAVSEWVGRELAFAREKGKTIVPIRIEPVDGHERFGDDLGVDATSPQGFATVIHGLMRDLYLSFDGELPPPDPAVLEAGLREFAEEEAELRSLIVGGLEGEGLHYENMDTVYRAAFHPLDHALNALFDLKPDETMAFNAAYGFQRAGAGTRALFSSIAATGNGGLPLVTALGQPLQPELISTAIKLLDACKPANNHALYQFIHHNAGQMDQEQRRSTRRLVTWPVRQDTSDLADVAAWVALKYFPEATEVREMWSRWIRTGAFDGRPSTPSELASYLADAHKEQFPGWDGIHETLRSHVRGYLRSGDRDKVDIAANHVRAAADAGAPVLAVLLREAEGVSSTWEWQQWEKRDPDTAERMRWYVFMVSREAAGERNWLRAWEEAKRMFEFEQERRELLRRAEKEPEEER